MSTQVNLPESKPEDETARATAAGSTGAPGAGAGPRVGGASESSSMEWVEVEVVRSDGMTRVVVAGGTQTHLAAVEGPEIVDGLRCGLAPPSGGARATAGR